MKTVQEEGPGVVIYLPQEGRGIGLANKIAAYRLQEDGLDTVEANRQLGLPDDQRRYDSAAAIIKDLGIKSICLMTNNPRKIQHLVKYGVKIESRRSVKTLTNVHSVDYIETKALRMGHAMDSRSLEAMLKDNLQSDDE